MSATRVSARRNIPSGPEDGGSPLSFPQERMFLLEQITPGLPMYSVPAIVRVRTTLDADILQQALELIIARHEILRTTVELVEGEPIQRAVANHRFELAVADLRGQNDAEREADALGKFSELARRPFELGSDVLLRAMLARVSANDNLLLIVLHHVASDHASRRLLYDELDTAYAALAAGSAPELPELPIQYADFARWQRDRISGSRLENLTAYWTGQLAGAPERLDLPFDRPRPSVQSHRGKLLEFTLEPDVVAPLRQLARRERVTLFTVLLTAFNVLLHRYTGLDDIVVGTPISGRSQPETAKLLGFFTNTLTLRSDLSGDPSFSEALARVRATTIQAMGHQELPFEKLVERINPQRTERYTPLFQVMFGYDVVSAKQATLAGQAIEPVPLPEWQFARFDLSIILRDDADSLHGRVEYATDLFDASTIERMVGHFGTLLEAITTDPSQRLWELPILKPGERAQLLGEAQLGEVDFPVACVHELFEDQAARRPDAPALCFGEEQLTYGELNEQANRLAHRLRGLGVGRESLVGLFLERSAEQVIAVLAVLKAGGAYVPLDPDYPADRVGLVLDDCQASVLIAQEGLLARLPAHHASVLCVDRDAAEIAAESAENPEPLTDPSDLAYIIYTSGSTGRPKGVQVEHRNVARLFSATKAWFEPDEADTWTLLHSYAFDFSVWEIWGALLHGGRLIVVPASTARSPGSLAALVVRERVTVLNATPSLFLTSMHELLERSDQLPLRLVVFGGEALQPKLLRPWFERFGTRGPALVNMYGITETTVHVTYRPLTPEDVDRASSPIGVPIPDLAVYLLDRVGAPVPVGVVGEMCVGGAGVARGYLNRPELTRERFPENPFAPGLMYRSGDQARRLPGGELEFHGRIDEQVKVRGFRIELGEIEAVLDDHAHVAAAVASVREDVAGDQRLVAYIVPAQPGDPPDIEALRQLLKAKLPPFMVPSAIIAVESFPLTANGKVDRGALPAPAFDRSAVPDEFRAPRTATERDLCAIWCSVLGIDAVGVDDDFFDLGGHSLLAVRLFAKIERELGVKLPLALLFQKATVAWLAEAIEENRSETPEGEWTSIVPMRPGDGRTPWFLVGWAGGEVLGYRDMVANLATDVPVYGLRAPGVDGDRLPLATVEELASHYVSEIRGLQPEGPYALGGYCFSGLVAYEMARQLLEQGEEISTLAMIDVYPYGFSKRPSRLQVERTKFDAFRLSDARGRVRWVRGRAVGLKNRVRNKASQTADSAAYSLLGKSRHLSWLPYRARRLVLVASNQARLEYVPKPTDVRVDFFRAQTEPDDRPTPFDHMALKGVMLHQIVVSDINHKSMMNEPHVHLLAAAVTGAIREASERPTPPPASTRLSRIVAARRGAAV